jgi:hypothetical protein
VPVWRGMRALMDGDLQAAAAHCDAAEALRSAGRRAPRRQSTTTPSGSSASTRATRRPTACARFTTCSRVARTKPGGCCSGG